MMIFWKARLAFLAVPKTGTTAYESALGDRADILMRNPPGIKHMNPRFFKNRLLPNLERGDTKDIETLAVMRNPLEWLGSWYRYRQRSHLNGKPNSTANVTFDQFVLDYLSETQPSHARVGRQYRFLTANDGTVSVDHLFDYAHLDHLTRFLEDRLEFRFSLARKNVSPTKKHALSAEIEAKLRTQCSEDFALYDALHARFSALD
ncbi:gamma-glutamyl kinase [Cochlodiniinecator piscidefendens]|uniref:gamma-glutamyl kinase n=1 Tax=Cochlodiniinecator piscidefendens TaxID=2715756 RepID=UPI001407489E|nr:gamma-glutamyl kinase [Cochlodiniinecator piscidefendens]